MKIVCISDTHNCNGEFDVPDGDLLIHAGDFTNNGSIVEVAAFMRWFGELPHRHKVLIAGNHDRLFEREPSLARSMVPDGTIYLQDSSAEIEGLKIYGSPWQPRFFDWAFNLMRGPELAAKWAKIPDDIDILITHGPPHGILDEVPRQWGIENTGCEELRKRVDEISANGKLKLHLFGHIHCGHGVLQRNGTTFINASVCNEEYEPLQPPLLFEI